MTGIARILSLALMMLGMSVFSAYGAAGSALEETDEIVSSNEEGAQGSLILSTDEISVIEGDVHQTITIRLGSQPSEDVRVIYRLSNPHIQVRIPSSSPYYIAFTPSDWDVPQTIGIRAFDDVDRIDYTDTISFSSTGFDTEVLTVNVFDYASVAPEGEIALSPTSLSISESGQGRFTVKLDVRPSAAVTISLTNTNPDITISPKTLTFRNDRWVDNWSETRIVDLHASEDSDSIDETDTVTLGASGGNYDGMSAVVSVAIVDEGDEEESAFDVQGSHELHGLKMKEGETKVISFMAVDGQLPDVDTVVSLTNTNPDITLTPNSLTFRPASSGALKGNLIQLVSVHAAQDSDLLDDTDTITLQGDIASSRRILVSIEDTTPPAKRGSLVLSEGALSVGEGRTATFTVKLDTKPSEDVRISLTNTNTDIALLPASLTFTASNWNVPQSVSVTAAHDSDYRGERDTITLSASGGGGIYDGVSATKPVAIVDDDIGAKPPAYLILSPDSLSLGHAVGRTGTFRVGLRTQPGEDVEVSLANTNPDVTFSPTTFTFTPAQWSAWRVVTVRADTGSDHTQSSADTIVLSASGDEAYQGLTARVSITIPDDVAWHGTHLDFSPSSLSLDEGGTGTFTVKLARWIYFSSTLLLTNTNPDITLSPSTLEFNALNWNVGQTVTVTAAQDGDASDDSDTVSFRDSSGDRFSQSASITVRDDDSGGIPLLSTTSLSLDEGASKTFTVKLDRRPSANTSISLTNTNPDITVNPTSLTFTASNWNAAQVVTVSAALDDDIVDDTDTITLSLAGFASKIVEVSIKDDKTVTPPGEGEGEIILSPAGTLVIDEGDKQNLEVKLGARPGADVTVSIANGNRDITPTPASLTFTTSNWNTAQSVSIAAALDDDDVNDSDTLTLRASGGGYESATVTKAISVIDIDREGGLPEILVLSTASLSLDEGASKTFTVKLTEQPDADTQVSLANTNTDITLNPGSLTFTASNWNTAQTVTVNAARDDDDKDDTDTITVSAAGFAPAIIDVSIEDDGSIEPPGEGEGEIILSPAGILVIDEGDKQNLEVKLGARPGADVTVSITNGNPDITPTPASLTFTTSSWNTAQSVSVAAALDDDDVNDSDTLTLRASGGGYESATVTKAISVIDIDREGGLPQILVLSTASLSLDEGGSKTFTVKLAEQPDADTDTQVSVANTNPDITITPASLTFTASNWNTAQTVTVSAARDDDDKDDTDTITLTIPDFAPEIVDVSVKDDTVIAPEPPDEPGEIILSATRMLMIGEGSRANLTVELGTRPSGAEVMVSFTKSNPNIALAPPSLVFTASNWNIPQTVVIEAEEDGDAANDTDTLTVSAPGFASKTLLIVVTDNGANTPEGEIVLNTQEIEIEEGGSERFTIRLDTKPSADVSVSLSRSNRDIEISPSGPLAFTASNWNIPQSVTVSAKVDADTEDDTGTVILKASGGIVAPTATLPVVIIDNTVISPVTTGTLSLSPGTPAIDEGGSGTFTVALGTPPSAAVTVSLTKTNPDIGLSSTSLSFDASNWSAARTITVRAAHDDDGTNDTDTITLIASGGNYAGVRATKTITVIDDDIEGGISGLILSTRLMRMEEGSSRTFTARLDKRPSRDIHLSFSSTNPDIALAPEWLIFTASNWNPEQAVTVSARVDSDKQYDIGTVIVNARGDSRGFVDLPSTILVFIDDTTVEPPPETGRLDLSAGGLAIREGESGSFTIALGVRPSVDVRVTLTKTNPDIALSPATPLAFTASNWSAAQTVTVKALHDDDAEDDSDTITVTASGGNYDEVTAGKSITVADDDIEGGIPEHLILSTSTLSVDEGGSKRFSVKLGTSPSRIVSVSSATADAALELSPTTLFFTDADWNQWQSFTVNALQDGDDTDDVALVILKAAGGIVESTKTILVTIVDRIAAPPPLERGALRLSAGPLEIEEGTSGAFTVALDVRPSAEVTVSLANTNPDIVLSPKAPLLFTASNWNVPQIITATAAHDDDDRDDNDTVRLNASGGNYDQVSAYQPITVFDDDLEEGEGGTPDLVLSKASLSVIRGGSQAFTVNLAANPSRTITVNSASSDADIALSPASLTFTDSDWDTPQTITVSVAQGSAIEQGAITLSASGLAPKTIAVNVSDAETNEPSIAPEEAAGALVLSTKRLSIGEGETGAFEVGLAIRPSRTVTISIDSDDRGITIAESRLYFTPSNWSATQALTLSAEEDEDTLDDTATITLTAQGGNYDGADAKVFVDVMDDDEPIALPSSVELPVKTQALALPPPTVQDSATMRVRCRSGSSPCIVRFNCTAQDGTVLTGVLPWTIPALGSMSFDSKEIANIVGGSWEGKGRLGCELQSDAKLGSQVWTRSGNGVLVNNSAAIRSAQEGSGYRADIESIPSPDSPEKSNIRIRCLAPPGASCSQISLACFDDAGIEYPGTLDPIPSRSVRHLQTRDLADIIAHRWQGMSLSCELRSNQPFTAQVLTRTGGGGALVNNSATGTK